MRLAGFIRTEITRFNEAIDQAVTESLSSYATEKDMQGRYVYVNKTSMDLYGLPQKINTWQKCA